MCLCGLPVDGETCLQCCFSGMVGKGWWIGSQPARVILLAVGAASAGAMCDVTLGLFVVCFPPSSRRLLTFCTRKCAKSVWPVLIFSSFNLTWVTSILTGDAGSTKGRKSRRKKAFWEKRIFEVLLPSSTYYKCFNVEFGRNRVSKWLWKFRRTGRMTITVLKGLELCTCITYEADFQQRPSRAHFEATLCVFCDISKLLCAKKENEKKT